MKTRDENGRFVAAKNATDRADICYRSKLLNRYFDDLGELEKAEDAYLEKHKAEIQAKEERKDAAATVTAAIKERIEAEAEARKVKKEAYEVFLKTCNEAEANVKQKRKEESELLRKFCEKYPEGFHETIKLGDLDYRYDYMNTSTSSSISMDPFSSFFNLIF